MSSQFHRNSSNLPVYHILWGEAGSLDRTASASFIGVSALSSPNSPSFSLWIVDGNKVHRIRYALHQLQRSSLPLYNLSTTTPIRSATHLILSTLRWLQSPSESSRYWIIRLFWNHCVLSGQCEVWMNVYFAVVFLGTPSPESHCSYGQRAKFKIWPETDQKCMGMNWSEMDTIFAESGSSAERQVYSRHSSSA